MATESALQPGVRLARGFVIAGAVFLSCSGLLVLHAAVRPVGVSEDSTTVPSRRSLRPLSTPRQDLDPLLRKMAGRRLVRPPQVQAAVKDTGAAKRLLKQLSLEGVVEAGGEFVAYVRIGKSELKTVRNGDVILELLVDTVEPGRITLSLEGVVVYLTH